MKKCALICRREMHAAFKTRNRSLQRQRVPRRITQGDSVNALDYRASEQTAKIRPGPRLGEAIISLADLHIHEQGGIER